MKHLSGEGIRVNQTLCFSAPQALLSAKAGAVYISPFLGRLDDIGAVGMDLVRDICEIYGNYGFKTQVLAASIRSPLHVLDAATGEQIGNADVQTSYVTDLAVSPEGDVLYVAGDQGVRAKDRPGPRIGSWGRPTL